VNRGVEMMLLVEDAGAWRINTHMYNDLGNASP
jgi:hypothetical protein